MPERVNSVSYLGIFNFLVIFLVWFFWSMLFLSDGLNFFSDCEEGYFTVSLFVSLIFNFLRKIEIFEKNNILNEHLQLVLTN